MFYTVEIDVPANTAIETPTRTVLKVSRGILRHVWFRWRWGSADLCGVRVTYQSHQIVPFNLTEWIRSFDQMIDFEEELEIDSEPYELAIETYNLDDTFAHAVWVAFTVLLAEDERRLYELMVAAWEDALYG